jgi:YD repeat-containing protein
MDLQYRNGQLQRAAEDPNAVDFTWSDGHVAKARSDDDEEYTFRYNARGNLVREGSSTGPAYEFAYDGRDNMTSITYLDGSKKVIAYDDEDRVISMTQRSGEKTVFEYQRDLADESRSVTKATRYAADGSAGDVTVFEMP